MSKLYGLPDMVRVCEDKDREIRELKAQLAEADRRAGAAERMLESEKDTTFRHRQWTREAKEAWGTDDRVSFDEVWAEAMALKHKFDDAVGCTVSERIRSAVADADLEIPLAVDTLEFVARDSDASPELRSDACRAIAGLTRLKTRLPAALRGPSPA